MKRNHNLFLFKVPDVFVIDTSAWLNIDKRADNETVWALILKLCEKGRVVICAEVKREIAGDRIYSQRIKPHENAFTAGDRRGTDIEFMQLVGRITFEHQAMSRATGTRTPADPYVIALAEMEGYVVVADENCRKRPNRKIPGVCAKRGLPCLTLAEFIAAVKSESE